MYGYNLLVSFGWRRFYPAREEIRNILAKLGDRNAIIKRTVAQGVAGASTILDPKQVIRDLYNMYNQDPSSFIHTLKWVPIDYWMSSDLESMANGIVMLRNKIAKGEKWMMVIEKRRYTRYHKIEIIKFKLSKEKSYTGTSHRLLRSNLFKICWHLSLILSN